MDIAKQLYDSNESITHYDKDDQAIRLHRVDGQTYAFTLEGEVSAETGEPVITGWTGAAFSDERHYEDYSPYSIEGCSGGLEHVLNAITASVSEWANGCYK